MAINPKALYPTKVATPTTEYPYGAAQNVTQPGDGTGTPWIADIVNDIFGMQQSFLSAAGLSPSGAPDRVGASQYLDAVNIVALARALGVQDDKVRPTSYSGALGDVKYLIDTGTLSVYGVPTLADEGETLISITGTTITTSGGDYEASGSGRRVTVASIAKLLAFSAEEMGYCGTSATREVCAGAMVETVGEGYRYNVAAPSATDNHVTTAGGVKLYVVPVNGEVMFSAFAPAENYNHDDKTGTSVTDLLVMADAFASETVSSLVFTGTGYRLDTPFCGASEPFNPIQADWVSRCGKGTTLYYSDETTNCWRQYTYTAKRRARQSHFFDWFGTGLDGEHWLLEDQAAGLPYVTFTDTTQMTDAIADGTLYVDMWVHVAAGKNPHDADDPLWRYDQLHQVKRWDTSTGDVFLGDSIDYPLSANGWIPGEGKNLATDWVTGEAVTEGEYRWNVLELWKALTAGTTSGTTLGDDTGVTWGQVTRDVCNYNSGLQSEKNGATDYRPMLQAAEYVEEGREITGILFEMKDTQAALSDNYEWRLASCVNWVFNRCKFLGRSIYPSEASRGITFNKCEFDTLGLFRSAIGNYNARKVVFDECVMNSGFLYGDEIPYGVVSTEGYGEYVLNNCRVNKTYRGGGYAQYNTAFFIQRGDIRVSNCFISADYLLRSYQEELYEDDIGTFEMSGANRLGGVSKYHRPMNVGQFYDRYPNWMQSVTEISCISDNIDVTHASIKSPFRPGREITLDVSIDLSDTATYTDHVFTRNDLRQAGVLTNCSYLLGMQATLDAYTVGDDEDIRCLPMARSIASTSLQRGFFRGFDWSTLDDASVVKVNSVKDYAANFNGKGTGTRFFNADEETLSVRVYHETGLVGTTVSAKLYLLTDSDTYPVYAQ